MKITQLREIASKINNKVILTKSHEVCGGIVYEVKLDSNVLQTITLKNNKGITHIAFDEFIEVLEASVKEEQIKNNSREEKGEKVKKLRENKTTGLTTWAITKEVENKLFDKINEIRTYEGFEDFHPYSSGRAVKRNKANLLTFQSGVGYEVIADFFGVTPDGRTTKMLNELNIKF